MLDKTQVTADIDKRKEAVSFCCRIGPWRELSCAFFDLYDISVLGQMSPAFSAEFRGYRNMESGG